MPIKSLSDRGLAFPEIGQIRKGDKKTEKAPGKDLTYFRVTFDEKEVEASKKFQEVYKDKPDAIHIILPFNDIDRQWEAWLEAYTAGRMVARTDGEFYNYLVDTKTGEVVIKNWLDSKGNKKPYKEGEVVGHDYKGKPVYAKPAGRLKVIVPELMRAAYLTVITTSVHDIAHISEQLAAYQEINGGHIAGIPFVLKRRPKMISRPDPNDKTRKIRSEKWMLSIEADPEWVKAKLTDLKHLALPGNGLEEPKQLPEKTEVIIDSTAEEVEEGEHFDPPSDPFSSENPSENAPTEAQETLGQAEITATVEDTPPDENKTPQSILEDGTEVLSQQLSEALVKVDKPGEKIWGQMDLKELSSKINAKLAIARIEPDTKKSAQLDKDISALKLVLEYRKTHPIKQ